MVYIETRYGVDIGCYKNDLEPLNGVGRVGDSGIDKTLPLWRVMELAYEIRANIIIKAGRNAKWYLKRFPTEEIEERISKKPRCTMYIIEWDESVTEPVAEPSDTSDSEYEEITERRPRIKRDMAEHFIDGQIIRHKFDGDKIWQGTYDAETNCIMRYEDYYKSLSAFALAHYKTEEPGRRKTVNGWRECEYKVPGSWNSTYSLYKSICNS
jgi:hypothetical protein